MINLITAAFMLFLSPGLAMAGQWDLENKSLRKELGKVLETELSDWKELPVPGWLPAEGKFFNAGQGDHQKYLYAGRVRTCRQGGCSASSKLTSVNAEFFDYFILYEEDLTVSLVRIYNYEATHGQEVMNKGWLKQFRQYDGSKALTIGKTIDAISGATISVYALTTDIQEKTSILRNMMAGKN